MEYTEYIKLYDDNCVFNNCNCPPNEKIPYSIIHQQKPLPLPGLLLDVIEMLLWYAPNIDNSAQTFEHEYLNDTSFDNAVMLYYLRYSGLNGEDICFINDKRLPQEYIDPFLNEACINCQKIIVTKYVYETKLTAILRHLRNCIAHGRFNLVSDNVFIGFDEYKNNCQAVFKLDINRMYSFCKQLIEAPEFTISHIFQYALLKNKYTILPFITGAYNHRDNSISEELVFAVKKDTAIRINCSRYLHDNKIDTVEVIK